MVTPVANRAMPPRKSSLPYHNCPRSESGIPIFVLRPGICQRRTGMDLEGLGLAWRGARPFVLRQAEGEPVGCGKEGGSLRDGKVSIAGRGCVFTHIAAFAGMGNGRGSHPIFIFPRQEGRGKGQGVILGAVGGDGREERVLTRKGRSTLRPSTGSG